MKLFNMTYQKAIQRVIKELQEDKDMFYSWQSNIAMAFVDECQKDNECLRTTHEIGNASAINFLNLLISKRT